MPEVGIFTAGQEFLVVCINECYERYLRYSTTEWVNIPRQFKLHQGFKDRVKQIIY